MSVAMQKKLEAFETWLYRRMLRISWKDMVTNEEVYRQMNIKQSLLVDIVRRQMSFLGHVLRKGRNGALIVGTCSWLATGDISHLPRQIYEQTTNGTVSISKGQSCLV